MFLPAFGWGSHLGAKLWEGQLPRDGLGWKKGRGCIGWLESSLLYGEKVRLEKATGWQPLPPRLRESLSKHCYAFDIFYTQMICFPSFWNLLLLLEGNTING